MIPVFFGSTLLVFYILQSVPDGPFEQAVKQIKMQQIASGEGGAATSNSDGNSMEISEDVLEKLRRQYGLDKPIWKRYLIWLGLVEKEIEYKEVEWGIPFRYTIENLGQGQYTPVSLQRWIVVNLEENGNYKIYQSKQGTDFEWNENYEILPDEDGFWSLIDEDSPNYDTNYLTESNWKLVKVMEDDMVGISLKKRQGIFTGYLGHSEKHNENVGTLIWDRLHISAFFGLTSFMLVYLVCIPLGIMKALKHGAKFDTFSSFVVFLGYSIPPYALAAMLLSIFATTNVFDTPILPSRGWRPEDWENLTLLGKWMGQIKHAFLPIIAYMVGSFATLTILMKNSLMENLSQDYVRTAFAKGLTEKKVIFFHAVRNSLIPLATGIGNTIGIFLAGSYLIEKIFGIDGIGLLTFKAIGTRDYGIIMGFLVIGVLIRLFGNLISDLCYALIDPRIRFK
ncbi:ABC transporter permease [bacterium]|nr:ABC transporter permease [bacterium]